jgi:methionyl-tRNA synthetase
MSTCLVTTTIPYVNARPHVGFALELVQADVIARWHRQKGDDTYFLTGTDENAIKNVVVAKEQGLTPRELCDRNATVFEDLLRKLCISSDAFIRTSSETHHAGARKFWNACSGDIATQRYRGKYCVGCEDFYFERDVVDGKCPIHFQTPQDVEEQNHFFQLSRYQDVVKDAIDSSVYRVGPDTRRNEALAFAERGLQDFSISRSIARSDGWGVRVPDDDTQTLYVWFDALTNYLNGVGYADETEKFAHYWETADRIIPVCGKDVLKFHALYWPAMLASAGLRLPTDLHVHGFLTVDGRKISKSVGNAVDPFPIIEQYGPDALRYYLLRHVPSGEDSDFSHERFAEVYESDLANGLGNLVSRLEALCVRAGLDRLTTDLTESPVVDLEDRRFNRALETLWETVRDINRDIESRRPWEYLAYGGPEDLKRILAEWISKILCFAHGVSPFLPGTASEIMRRFSADSISRGTSLFPRIRQHNQ